jgi:crossover junction endodeoxyribonuclease RusA
MLTVTLPFPAPELFPNRANGKHYRAVKDHKEKAWSDAYTMTHQAVNQHKGEWYPLTGDIPLTLTFFPADKRHRDLDNCLAACKSLLDGMATALTVNDKQFGPITIVRGGVAKPACVLVKVGA